MPNHLCCEKFVAIQFDFTGECMFNGFDVLQCCVGITDNCMAILGIFKFVLI